MNLSANSLKWLMRFYPPLLFNRIWIKSISPDFQHAEVKVFKSLMNTNFNGSIFGGTLFCAADPFFALLIWGIFKKKDIPVQVWMKSASVQFLKPAISSLVLRFDITKEEIKQAENMINERGKYIHVFVLEAKMKDGEVCATFQNEVYARKLELKP